MIYTFSFSDEFLNSFKDKLSYDESYKIYNFIIINFIKRDNFFLRTEGKRKSFFKIETNGGNGAILKNLINKLNRKYKEFPKKVSKSDFLFSNEKTDDPNVISFSKIFENQEDLEEKLDEKYKSYWQPDFKATNQQNKRNLAKIIERIFNHSDEVFFIDRHVSRTLLDSKKKFVQPKDINYAKSYLNSFNYLNSLLIDKKVTSRFYSGLLKSNLKFFSKNQEIDIEKELKEFFSNFSNSGTIVHIISKYEAYDNLQFYKRLIVGLINKQLLVMVRTEKGLNILNEENELHKSKRKFDYVKEEIALDDWEDWNINVRYVKPEIKFVA